jgi:hypothetical protein
LYISSVTPRRKRDPPAAAPNLVLVVMLGTGLRANSSVRHHHALISRVGSILTPAFGGKLDVLPRILDNGVGQDRIAEHQMQAHVEYWKKSALPLRERQKI